MAAGGQEKWHMVLVVQLGNLADVGALNIYEATRGSELKSV